MLITIEIQFAGKVQQIELSMDKVTILNKDEANLLFLRDVCNTIAHSLESENKLREKRKDCFARIDHL
jgi:hypothetical protein